MSKEASSNIKLKYTFSGLLFGLLFPLGAYGVLKLLNESIQIKELVSNPLFVIICLAPIVLSLAAYFVASKISKTIIDLELARDTQIEIIEDTVTFVKNIASGNYDATNVNETRNQILFNALTEMGSSLKVAALSDYERNWIISGETEVGDILRASNNLKLLADELVVYLTKKIEVIQCAFYIYNTDDDNNKFIELVSSYAYNRKKYLNATFKLGQGLVGQSMIEQSTIYRTEIPTDYVTITSGLLGDKKPMSILIVPLITDEKVFGAIEFSSLNYIPKLHIQFLDEVSDIIARTIFNVSVNEKTLKLLNESQKMSSELHLQREQLLQNAEEMTITQEELSKANINLEKQIEEVNNTQKRMQTLLQNASELITVFDTYHITKYISPSVRAILGYSEAEFVGQKHFVGLNEKGKVDLNQMLDTLLKEPENSITIEFSLQKKDGTRIWLESHGTNLLSDPAIQGIVLNSRDITMRRKAQEEEKKSGQMQALSENSVDLIIRLNNEGQFFYINPTIEKYTGRKPEFFLNQQIDNVELYAPFIEFCKSTCNEIFLSKEKKYLETNYTTSQQNFVLRVAAIPELNKVGDVETVLLVLHDITEQKQTEIQIKEKNKNITESINYSYNIQSSLMPDEKVIRNYFKNSFLFYKPKDVVSGDFPWLFAYENNIYIATVDCTGHGVPGALMSFIGYFTLNNILVKNPDLNCGEILDKMHAEVQRVLRQDTNESQAKDGMDIALCRVNVKTNAVDFSGAHRPMYLHKSGEFEEVKGDKYPVAGLHYRNRLPFVNNTVQLSKGDSFYIFTDGFPDQFGGPTGKEKIYSTRIQELIKEKGHLQMHEMGTVVENFFYDWKGKTKQLDDVLMIGVKI